MTQITNKELPEEFEDRIAAVGKLWEPGVVFTDRELRLIVNSQMYAMNDPAGLPGHNLMVIIDKFDQLMGQMASYLTPQQVDACARMFQDEE
jgi:hypothetical protein